MNHVDQNGTIKGQWYRKEWFTDLAFLQNQLADNWLLTSFL